MNHFYESLLQKSTLIGLLLLAPIGLKAETEPNNDSSHPTLISAQGNMTGTLGSGDADWYLVTLPDDGTLTLKFEGTGDLQCDNLRIYEYANLHQLARGSYGTTASVTRSDLGKGSYLLLVTYWSGKAGSYTLTTTFTAAGLPNDPEFNDSIQQAVNLPLNSSLTGRLFYILYPGNGRDGYYDPRDWYKLVITESGKLTVNFTGESTLRCDNLRLYDSNQTTQLAYGTWGNSAIVSKENLLPGTYYLKVPGYDGYGSYTLTTTFTKVNLLDDNEPNDTWQNAQVISLADSVRGRLGFENASITDNNDWYELTLPEDGTLRLKFLTDGVLRINNPSLYTEDDGVEERRIRSGTWGKEFEFSSASMGKGKYWLHVPRYDGFGTYRFIAEFVPATYAVDAEPNDHFSKAMLMEPGKTYTGHLAYFRRSTSIQDNRDWYRFELPGSGTVRFHILTDSVLQINNPYLYCRISDTIQTRRRSPVWKYDFVFESDDLAAGSYALELVPYSQFGSYKLTYEYLPVDSRKDKEPNNGTSLANPYSVRDSVNGEMGYWYNTAPTDNNDWYRFRIPRNGIVWVTVDISPTMNHEIYLHGPDSSTLVTKHSAGYVKTRTMKGVGLLANTDYFIRIRRWDGYGTYRMKSEYLPVPTAGFRAIQNLSTVMLNNESLDADSLVWDFGDGTTSSKTNPSHQYATPGWFTVKLKAINEAGVDSIEKHVSVRGIQRVESDRGGNGGKVTVRINAGGLKSGVQAYLRRGTQTIAGTGEKFITAGDLEVQFDLYSADLGKWDVVLQNPTESEMVLANGFTVEEGVLPVIWSDIQGRNRFVFGRWQTYTVMIGNKGNIDALARLVWIVTPDNDSTEVEFLNLTFDYPEVYPSNFYSAVNGTIPYYIKLDSLNGKAQKIRCYGIMLPSIPANSELAIKLRIRDYKSYPLAVFQTAPLLDPSEMTALRSANGYDSYAACQMMAMLSYLADKVAGKIEDMVPGLACGRSVVSNIYDVGSKYMDRKLSAANFAYSVMSTTYTCAKDALGWSQSYEMACFVADLVFDIVGNGLAFQECQQYRKTDEKVSNKKGGTSDDPNEMIGPKGFGSNNVVDKMVFPYTILFENKKTAAFPAQEVVILDTLDVRKFDLKTLRFNGFGFSGKTFSVIQDSNSFVQEIDLRPAKNALLRVSGTADPKTGLLRWQFLTLDPETMDLTEDPEAGFLPPNVNAPEGDGFVSFTVGLQEMMRSGDTISNRADIRFDLNKNILTNLYQNIVDEVKPTSRIRQIRTTSTPGELELHLEGSDKGGAGIRYYDLYMATEDSAFVLKKSDIKDSILLLRLPRGKNYRFYTLATDSLSYTETPKNTADQSIYLGLSREEEADPNMLVHGRIGSRNQTVVYRTASDGWVRMHLLSTTGQVVRTLVEQKLSAGVHRLTLSELNLPGGLYIVQLANGNQLERCKLILY